MDESRDEDKSRGGEADCGGIRNEMSTNVSLLCEGMRVRRRMNGVGKRSRLRIDPQRNGKREGDGAGRCRKGAIMRKL